MYALKQARLALSADPEASGSIFHIDLRLHPRGGEEYLAKARELTGGRLSLVRARVHGLEAGEGGAVRIRYMDEGGGRRTEEFDMAVLSLGLGAGESARELLAHLMLAREHGFARTAAFEPTATSLPGIYACGGSLGPVDVHDALLQASSAAVAASGHLRRASVPSPPLWPRASPSPRAAGSSSAAAAVT